MAFKPLKHFPFLIILSAIIISFAAGSVLLRPLTVSASCSDACHNGDKRCSGSGYQVCGNYDSDYCYEWSGTKSCGSGYKCSNGSCVRSCSDKCSNGSKKCSGNTIQICRDSNGDNCTEWVNSQTCGSGYRCSGGSCVKSCTDKCSAGQKRCSGSGIQACGRYNGSACYSWSNTQSCGSGYKCSNGKCVRSCSDKCSSGSKKCSGSTVMVCSDKNGDGCREWVSGQSCGKGYKCSNGSCVRSCSDKCSRGDKKCSGNSVQTCGDYNNDSCVEWGNNKSCGNGYKCSNGSCVRSCSDKCSAGQRKCSGNGYQTCGKYNGSPCYSWSSTQSCGSGYKCSNGKCVRSCSDKCSRGEKRCSGGSVQTCGDYNNDSCSEWGNAKACNTGYKCSNGECVRSCTDKCPRGDKRCSGNSVQTCGDYNNDTCVEWGNSKNCGTGYKCQNGNCVRSCSDKCSKNDRRCSGNSYQVCGDYNNDTCNEWGKTTKCNYGYKCENGNCVKSCSDECGSNQRRCSGNGYQTCGSYDSDECRDWSDVTPCNAGYKCSNGKCVRACSDKCSAGQKRCAYGGYQTCGDFNDDTCLEWSQSTACGYGYKCQNGECVRSCSNKCQEGEKKCSGNGIITCGDYNNDTCFEWGSSEACETGYKCRNGECARSCSDKCQTGERRCSGNRIQTCGDYNNDTCVEWGGFENCDSGFKCQNGECVRSCSDKCQNGDKRCSGGSIQTCGDYNGDTCVEWGNSERCETGFKCQNGECVRSCSDKCQEGDKRCSGNSVQTCGDYNNDTCVEWGNNQGCGTGYKCQNGECVISCTDKCSEGQRRCAYGGYQTCGDSNDDTCLEWSQSTACGYGYKCQGGECVRSCTDRCQEGEKRCSGNNIQTCSDINDDTCMEWGNSEPCETGYKCRNGECARSCTDKCQSGEKKCSGNNIQTCGDYNNDTCVEWGNTDKCESGYRCQNGECVRSCTDKCSDGDKRCLGNRIQTCGDFNGDTCVEWGGVETCDTGYKCRNGECVRSCTDKCQEGEKKCSGNNIQTCGDYNDDTCFEWGNNQNCGTGFKCQNGGCVRSCTDKCQSGEKKCSGNKIQTCGDYNDDTCYEWGGSEACESGFKCQNGECVRSCQDKCQEGEKKCSGNSIITCGDYNNDTCLEWGNGENCGTGYKCQNGECVRSCSDKCSRGDQRCSGNGYQTCGFHDDSECLDWSPVTPCGSGQRCENGECVKTCSDQCQTGEKRCSGNGYQVCGFYNGDECASWSRVTKCVFGYTCQDGECVKSCSDECMKGERKCSGNGYQSCGKYDLDECYEWSNVKDCSSGYVCQDGECVKSCSDQCRSGEKKCDGDGYQVCGYYDNDKCTSWSDTQDCEEGYKCQNGKCVKTCSDQCQPGDQRCAGNGYQTCGNYNSDSCYEWSNTKLCNTGYTCEDGECVRSCSDECSRGDKRCSGNGIQTCGDYNDDQCLEWSETEECEDGYKCQNGECVRSCADACTQGKRRCSGNSVQICEIGDNDCTGWVSEKDCEQGYACKNGECVRSCQDKCQNGGKRCSGNGIQTCGDYNDDTCTEWGNSEPCGTGFKCRDGECVRSCTDKCQEGEKKCSGNGIITCGDYNDDTCVEWGGKENCGSGYKCQDGECVISCTDKCSEGQKRCAYGGYQTCGDFNDDTCLEWSQSTACGYGYKCQGGECVRSCTDRCSTGEKRCSGNNIQTCGDYNDDTCTEWGNNEPCESGYKCRNGECVRSCQDKCQEGEKKCSGDNIQTCGDYNDDECFEWGNAERCETGFKCRDGECIRSCSDKCQEGEKKCSGNGIITCGDYNNDTCFEWGSKQACQSGYKCQDGECVISCKDKCADGQHECKGTSGRECRANDSGCYEWGEYEQCDSRCYSCGDGRCDSACGEGKDNCAEDCGSDKPTVVLDGPPTANCGERVTLTWSSTNTDSCQASGGWSGWKQSSGSEEIGQLTSGKTFKITCSGPGGSATDSLAVKLASRKPNADAGSDKSVDEDGTVELDGSADGGSDLSYRWTCNGGSVDDPQAAETEFYAPEIDRTTIFVCTLAVENECGEKDSDTVNITVNKREPGQLSVQLDATPSEGCAPLRGIDLTARVFGFDEKDLGGGKITYYFDCGNGDSRNKTVTSGKTSVTVRGLCSYDEPGRFTARVKAETRDWDRSASDTVRIEAEDCEGPEEPEEEGDIKIEKYAANLTTGTGYEKSVYAEPGDMISFKIAVTAMSGDVDDVIVKDNLPNGIIDPCEIRFDNGDTGDSIGRMEIGDLEDGESAEITFTAAIAGANKFKYGQTVLTNTAYADSDNGDCSAQAKVIVTRKQVRGATSISTGFTNNPFVDSFVFPAGAASFLVWAFRARLLKIEEWLDAKKQAFANFRSRKLYESVVSKLKAKNPPR